MDYYITIAKIKDEEDAKRSTFVKTKNRDGKFVSVGGQEIVNTTAPYQKEKDSLIPFVLATRADKDLMDTVIGIPEEEGKRWFRISV